MGLSNLACKRKTKAIALDVLLAGHTIERLEHLVLQAFGNATACIVDSQDGLVSRRIHIDGHRRTAILDSIFEQIAHHAVQ